MGDNCWWWNCRAMKLRCTGGNTYFHPSLFHLLSLTLSVVSTWAPQSSPHQICLQIKKKKKKHTTHRF